MGPKGRNTVRPTHDGVTVAKGIDIAENDDETSTKLEPTYKASRQQDE
jgi:hypothetical protein